MKYIFSTIIIFYIAVTNLQSQLTLDECQEKALKNYPLIKQYDLIKQSADFNLSNADKGYFPQILLSVKATYQSDVIEIPIQLPLFTLDKLSKDQYQANAEISQTLWDGGAIKSQKKIILANSEITINKLEVDLYTLKERINQLYFGILLIDEHIKRNDALQTELRTNLEKITALRNNGVATDTDVDVINVEIINAKQRKTELIANRKAFAEMLSIMIGENVSDNTELIKPVVVENREFETGNNRPEIKLFDSQSKLFETQKDLIDAATIPKIGLFFQGGYGKPGFNLLKNEFDFYYIGGIRLTWNLSGFYILGNSYEILETNRKSSNLMKETFLFNNNLKTGQQKIEIEKFKQLIKNDDEIIKLRTNIKKTSEVKVENGTMSVSDLIRDINNENFAILDKAMHEIQLLIAVYNYKFLIND